MAITKLNSLAIPPDTIVESDLSYPLTNFSSTGIDDNATSTAVTIDSSENVGVGDTAPDVKLKIKGGTGTIEPQVTIESTAFNSGQGTALNFSRAGFDQPIQARISAVDNGAAGSNFIFSTKVDGTAGALTERMRIDSSGNVGIGTSPSSNLHVYNGTDAEEQVIIAEVSGGFSNGAGVSLRRSGTEMGRINADYFNGMTFHATTGSGGAATERMRINSSGNVGIGTSDPANTLHVHTPAGGAQLRVTNTNTGQTSSDGFHIGTDTPGGVFLVQNEAQPMYFYTSNAERMRLDASGNLLVGRTSVLTNANADLHVDGGIAGQGFCTRAGSSGAFTNNIFNIQWPGPNLWIDSTNVGTISVSSDYRIKRNIETQTENAIDRVKLLRPVTYQRANFEPLFVESDEIKEGFIAHEVADVIPSAVEGEKDASNQIQSLKLDALCSVLTKAIQEQQAMIETLQAQVAELQGAN